MPNLRIIHDNAADRATVTASTTAGDLVAASMLTEIKGEVHRSTGTGVTYTLAWADGESIGGVALPATNLTADATIQVRLYSDVECTALIADSGVGYACPGLNLGMWDWTVPLNANAFAFGGLSKSAVWFDDHYFAKGCKIDLVDAGNGAGYIDCSRIVAGAYWEPEYNASYGLDANVVDTSTTARNDAGDLLADRGTQHDSLSFSLDHMREGGRARLMMIFRQCGTARNLFVSIFPGGASSVAEQDHMIYGKRANSGVAHSFYAAFSNKITMEGW
jgi:hypothetical protein